MRMIPGFCCSFAKLMNGAGGLMPLCSGVKYRNLRNREETERKNDGAKPAANIDPVIPDH